MAALSFAVLPVKAKYMMKMKLFFIFGVMHSVDNQSNIYRRLGDMIEELSDDSKNSELQLKLAGFLHGIYAAKFSNKDVELSLYQNYSNKADNFHPVMLDGLSSYMLIPSHYQVCFDMSEHQLGEVSQIYSQLADCFYRGDKNSFASLIMEKDFESEAFRSSLQQVDDLLSELSGLVPFKKRLRSAQLGRSFHAFGKTSTCKARALPLPALTRPCLIPIPFYPLTEIGRGRTPALHFVDTLFLRDYNTDSAPHNKSGDDCYVWIW